MRGIQSPCGEAGLGALPSLTVAQARISQSAWDTRGLAGVGVYLGPGTQPGRGAGGDSAVAPLLGPPSPPWLAALCRNALHPPLSCRQEAVPPPHDRRAPRAPCSTSTGLQSCVPAKHSGGRGTGVQGSGGRSRAAGPVRLLAPCPLARLHGLARGSWSRLWSVWWEPRTVPRQRGPSWAWNWLGCPTLGRRGLCGRVVARPQGPVSDPLPVIFVCFIGL